MHECPLVDKLAFLRQYAWSSHRDYSGARHRFEWLMRGLRLDLVAEGHADREVAYRQFVERGLAEPDEELDVAMVRSSKAIGGAEFSIAAKFGWITRSAALQSCAKLAKCGGTQLRRAALLPVGNPIQPNFAAIVNSAPGQMKSIIECRANRDGRRMWR